MATEYRIAFWLKRVSLCKGFKKKIRDVPFKHLLYLTPRNSKKGPTFL